MSTSLLQSFRIVHLSVKFIFRFYSIPLCFPILRVKSVALKTIIISVNRIGSSHKTERCSWDLSYSSEGENDGWVSLTSGSSGISGSLEGIKSSDATSTGQYRASFRTRPSDRIGRKNTINAVDIFSLNACAKTRSAVSSGKCYQLINGFVGNRNLILRPN